jgi:hypothetical protein
MRQQRLLLLWIRFSDQRAAVAVGHGDTDQRDAAVDYGAARAR